MFKNTWVSKQLSNDVLSSVLHGGAVFGSDVKEMQARVHRSTRAELRCLDFTTGKVLWLTDEVGHASLLVADGKLILWSDEGTLILARASSAGYEELARHALLPEEGVCWTPPTLWQGRLFLRNQRCAVSVWLGDPSELSDSEKRRALEQATSSIAQRLNWRSLLGKERDFPNDVP